MRIHRRDAALRENGVHFRARRGVCKGQKEGAGAKMQEGVKRHFFPFHKSKTFMALGGYMGHVVLYYHICMIF